MVKKPRSPETPATAPPPVLFQNILVPVDFSENSEKALDYAAAFASQTGARLTLLHVMEPMAYGELQSLSMIVSGAELYRGLRGKLQLLCRRKGIRQELISESLVSEGSPYQVINSVATRLETDLIVISLRGLSGVAQAFVGGTAERVVWHAPCPVLIIR